jgi:hypothetical protein
MRSCARPSRTRWPWTRCSRPALLNEQSGLGRTARTRRSVDNAPAPNLFATGARSPAVDLLPPGRLYRRTARRAAVPALGSHQPGPGGNPDHGLDSRHRRSADRGYDQGRPVADRQHRPRHRPGTERAPHPPGRRADNRWSGVTRPGRRLRIHHSPGRARLSRHRVAAHAHPGQQVQLRQSRLKAARPIPVARLHDLRHVHATTLLRARRRAQSGGYGRL